jgi:uncharacterized membrane protein
MDVTTFWRALAGLGILGLIILCIVWNGWLTPVQDFPRSIEIALLVAPLLYFVRGVMRGNRDTFIAVMLVAFVYMLMGIWYAFSAEEKIYGYLMLLFSLFLFFGSLLNVWILDKRDKLGQKKI